MPIFGWFVYIDWGSWLNRYWRDLHTRWIATLNCLCEYALHSRCLTLSDHSFLLVIDPVNNYWSVHGNSSFSFSDNALVINWPNRFTSLWPALIVVSQKIFQTLSFHRRTRCQNWKSSWILASCITWPLKIQIDILSLSFTFLLLLLFFNSHFLLFVSPAGRSYSINEE